MLSRPVLTGVLVVAALIAGAAPAVAGGGAGSVQCGGGGTAPGCQVTASNRQVIPGAAAPVHPSAGSPGGGTQLCKAVDGETVPCDSPAFGWMGTDGCYYQADTGFTPPPGDTADQHSGQAGAWYDSTCPGTLGTGGGLVWLPSGAIRGAPPPPPPTVLARQAVNQLRLPSPVIQSSPAPAQQQMVRVPTWLWIGSATWKPQSATAAVPGESVTATATPATAAWRMGDGATVACHGPGTPYPGGDPARSSPTCGHTYRRSSAGQPGNAFAVSVTVTWTISWAGGGETGALPALTTTAGAAFAVAESQTLVTTTSS